MVDITERSRFFKVSSSNTQTIPQNLNVIELTHLEWVKEWIEKIYVEKRLLLVSLTFFKQWITPGALEIKPLKVAQANWDWFYDDKHRASYNDMPLIKTKTKTKKQKTIYLVTQTVPLFQPHVQSVIDHTGND